MSEGAGARTVKVLYLHGLGVEPGGVIPSFLDRHGLEVIEPALPHGDFDEAVAIAQSELATHQPDVVAGCSRGGAVAMELSADDVPLILIAPAWRKWGPAEMVKRDTTILHSPHDRVIRFEDSVRLVRNSGLPESALIPAGADHFFCDEPGLRRLLKAVRAAAATRGVPA